MTGLTAGAGVADVVFDAATCFSTVLVFGFFVACVSIDVSGEEAASVVSRLVPEVLLLDKLAEELFVLIVNRMIEC